MSELIQIDKTEDPHPEFMTEWTSILEKEIQNYDGSDAICHGAPISLGSHKMCCVGEAHKFSDSYMGWLHSSQRCDFCREQSDHGVFQAIYSHDIQQFYTWKDTLYNHMKEVHWK